MNNYEIIINIFGKFHQFAKKLYAGKYIEKRVDKDALDKYIGEYQYEIMVDLDNFFGRAILNDQKIQIFINEEQNQALFQKIQSLVRKGNYIDLLYFFNNQNPSSCLLNQFKKFLVYFHVVERIQKGILETKPEESVSIDEYINDGKNNEKLYFRGQSNYNWSLVPSCCRNLNYNGAVIFETSHLIKKYIDSKKTHKFKNVFEKDYCNNLYEFLAFMQHSISYSPLIDFTERPEVALSFALYDNSLDYFYNDAAFYIMRVNEGYILNENNINRINNILKNYSFLSIDKGASLQSVITNPIWSNNYLKCNGGNMYVIDIKSNDRMKYQHGVFVLFDKFIMIDGKLVLTDYQISRFEKKLIRTNCKNYFMKKINGTQFEYRYLMNPYLYFGESYWDK